MRNLTSFSLPLLFLALVASISQEAVVLAQNPVSFFTNLPEDRTAPSQLFVVTANSVAEGSTRFRFFRSATGLKPATPFFEEEREDCLENCNVSVIVRAGDQPSSIFLWVDVTIGPATVSRTLQVLVSDSAPLCAETSFRSCDCGTSIDAGCPAVTGSGGTPIELIGGADHPDFSSEVVPEQSYRWSILDAGDLEGIRIENPESLVDARIVTPQIIHGVAVLVELSGTVAGCACNDLLALSLEPTPSLIDLSLSVDPVQFELTEGDRVDHEFVVSNRAAATASQVELLIPIPDGLDLVGSETGDSGCVLEDGVLSCPLGDIPGDSARSAQVSFQATTPGAFSVEVRVESAETEFSPPDNRLTLSYEIAAWNPDLVFPLSLGGPSFFPAGSFVGISLLNSGAESSEVELTRLDGMGNRTGPFQLSDLLGDRLPPRGQYSALTSELTNPADDGLLAARSEGPIMGFSLFGDFAQTRLDGFPIHPAESTRLVFPLATQGARTATRIYLHNPLPEIASSGVLRLFDFDGRLIAEKAIDLAPLGSLSQTLFELFGVSAIDGYLEINSDHPITGFEVVALESAFVGIPAQAVTGQDRFTIPHFFSAAGEDGSTLRVVNVGPADVEISVRGYNDDGSLIGGSILNLARGGVLEESTRNLVFGLESFHTGYLQIEVKAVNSELPPEIVGAFTFTSGGGRAAASLPLRLSQTKAASFLQVAQEPGLGIFTGLAILNPGDEEIELTIRVFNLQGQLTFEKTIELAKHSRRLGLLPELLGDAAFTQIGGHIELSSDLPFLAFALFGDFRQNFLAAVEGQ